MTAKKQKTEIITFKADETLLSAMEGIDNRSEFIRDAVAAALEGTCPLCMGTGFLTPSQRQHWEKFSADHTVIRCDECHEKYLVCAKQPKRKKH